jgi:hypothetical protein
MTRHGLIKKEFLLAFFFSSRKGKKTDVKPPRKNNITKWRKELY